MLVINIESVLNSLGFIVLTDNKLTAAKITYAVLVGLFIFRMIAGTTFFANSSS